ncbi:MAG TPA: metal-sulfur cluster assembly factor, partial [Longimicrobiales bacterium]|nr:metal-sulfur cluster assembly factor [Longimicrobiales bacterium]
NAAVGAPLLDHVTVRPGMERYWRALKEVIDPELPISVVDMGLIYDIDIDLADGGRLDVTMTFTATACPCMSLMEMDIRDRLLKEPGVERVRIHVVWTPAWNRGMLTDEGRVKLRKYGIAA